EDHLRLHFADLAADRVRVGQVEARAIGRHRPVDGVLELDAHLPVAAGEQDPHGKTSASASFAPFASRGERMGAPERGQRMPSFGSSQAITRSCSGAQNSLILYCTSTPSVSASSPWAKPGGIH